MKQLPFALVAVLSCGTLLSGCSGTSPLSTTSPSVAAETSPASGAVDTNASVDPQVLNDAVAGIFQIPGDEQLRAMRVDRFIDNAGLTACGTTPPNDLDATSVRFDQSHTADLDLIARKGLVEDSATEAKRAHPDNECVVKALPHHSEWFALMSPWDDVMRAAVQTPAVTETQPGVTSCLRSVSGFTVDAADPTSSFLDQVDNHLSRAKGEAQWQTDMMKYSQMYAQCTPPYFDALKAELLDKRPALIERHRETLTAFARDLVAAGYTP